MGRRRPIFRLPTRTDLDDERVLIGVVAGALWLAGGVVAGLAALLPGSPGDHEALRTTLSCLIVVYGVASIVGPIDWRRMSVRSHALASATLMPLIGAGLWATGGEDSYLQPLLIFVLLHEAFFFPPRYALPLIGEMVLVYASPMLYDAPTAGAYPARVLTFAVVAVMLTFVLRVLKGRLVAAEDRQRRMALEDPLTGLANRRAFDQALALATVGEAPPAGGRRALDDDPGLALILVDLDGFKEVNDTHGHPAGDRLLKRVAASVLAAVRPDDLVARIGGDEFAVIAARAGAEGAERLAADLRDAIAEAGVGATVAWALRPQAGASAEDLLHEADRRLYAGKAETAERPSDLSHV